MLIRPVSDLHIDFSNYTLSELGTDKESVLSVAGDLCEMGGADGFGTGFFSRHCPRFKHVVFVLGNHESYGGEWGAALRAAKALQKEFPNLYVLDNEVVALDGVKFGGTTFWTDCDRENPMTFWRLKRGMADFTHIRNFSPEQSCEENKKAIEFLLAEKPTVVVTHHSPTRLSEDPKYKDSPVSGGFSSDLDEVIYQVGAKVWHHGHIHYASDYRLFGTRMVCNARGYRAGFPEETGFKDNLVIEV